MPVTVTWDGLIAWRAEWLALPRTLAALARPLVQAQAAATADAIRGAYPLGKTGDLRAGVSWAIDTDGPFGIQGRVHSDTWYARLYEHGTKLRETKRRPRPGIPRGRMLARPVFDPAMAIGRRALRAQLIAMVRAQGLTVTDDG